MMNPTLKNTLLAATLAASLTGLSGCAEKAPISPFPHAVRPADAASLKFEAVASGEDSNLKLPGVSVISTKEELIAVGGDAAKLTVDFEKQMVVVLALGKQPTAGYWARITGVYSSSGVLWVQGIASRPNPSSKPVEKTTSPYAAVVVDKTDGVIVSDIASASGVPAPMGEGSTPAPAAEAPAPAAPSPAAAPKPEAPVAPTPPAAKEEATPDRPAAAPKPEAPVAPTPPAAKEEATPDRPAAAPKPEAPVAPTPPAAKEAAPRSPTAPAAVDEPMK